MTTGNNDGVMLQHRLYTDLASWYYLLTAPEEYAEEAALYRQMLIDASVAPVRTLLELGCGGGCNASYFKRDFTCTLTDLSPQMLELSQGLNPECEHVQGDMRTLRLGRTFDAVFVHDAVCYLTSEDDLRQAMATAFVHLRPGGVAVFAPDYVRETFVDGKEDGGNDGDGRALRYYEWVWDPDPADTTYQVDFVYMLREDGQPLRVEHEVHIEGLFGRDDWLRLLTEAGFRAKIRPFTLEDWPQGEVFVAVRPS